MSDCMICAKHLEDFEQWWEVCAEHLTPDIVEFKELELAEELAKHNQERDERIMVWFSYYETKT